MSDRERDLSLLRSFCVRNGKSIQGWGVIGIALCTALVVGAALLITLLSRAVSAALILVASLSCMALVIILIQYYVAGPLFREVQRLKNEIDSLKPK